MGAAAICGLPPLNGFVSEFLIYLGLFRSLGLGDGKTFVGAAFVAPSLALIGALALACFVKVFGAVFLGSARTKHAETAHESPAVMIGPMLVLVVCCLGIGLSPSLAAPVLDCAIQAWHPTAMAGGLSLTELAPLNWIGWMAAVLLLASAAVGGWLALRMSRSEVQRTGTWGCGYAAPTARMQYTSSSFGEMLVGLFARVLRPKTHLTPVEGLFPAHAAFSSHVDDVVLDDVVLPASRRIADWLFWFRWMQQGSIQAYLTYILAMLFVLFVWQSWEFWTSGGWLGWGWSKLQSS